jgi:hypothetical protein
MGVMDVVMNSMDEVMLLDEPLVMLLLLRS